MYSFSLNSDFAYLFRVCSAGPVVRTPCALANFSHQNKAASADDQLSVAFLLHKLYQELIKKAKIILRLNL